jgi:hypothetical protein
MLTRIPVQVTDEQARERLDRLVSDGGDSFTELSRMIGRPASYLNRYVRKGVPRSLADGDRTLLARYFRVTEFELGAPAPPVQERTPVGMKRPEKTFGEWLLDQKKRDDWIGELARGAAQDQLFPKLGMPWEVMERVRQMTGEGDMQQAVDAAADEWLDGYGWALQDLIEPPEPDEKGLDEQAA